MDRDVYAKLVKKIKDGEINDQRFDFEHADFKAIQYVSASQGRITFTFVYPTPPETDYIAQLVFAPDYIRVDTMVSGEVVSKTVSLT